MGMLSYARDSTIGTFFLGLDPSVFEGLLRSTVADVETANEQRVRSFIADGGSHTFLGGDLSLSVEGVTLYDWVDAMINEPLENWESVSGAPIRDE
jgi:hypothetical protein